MTFKEVCEKYCNKIENIISLIEQRANQIYSFNNELKSDIKNDIHALREDFNKNVINDLELTEEQISHNAQYLKQPIPYALIKEKIRKNIVKYLISNSTNLTNVETKVEYFEDEIRKIQSKQHSIKVFLENKEKDKVIDEYKKLRVEAREFLSSISESLDKITEDNILDYNEYISDNFSSFEAFLNSICNEKWTNEDYFVVPKTSALEAKKILNKFKKIKTENDYYLKKIKETHVRIDLYVKHKYLEELKKHSIEEINQNKNGIKISYLKKAGINNLLDLNLYDVNKLSYLEGISEKGAYKIITSFKLVSAGIQRNIKINLKQIEDEDDYKKLITNFYFRINFSNGFNSNKTILESFAEEEIELIKFVCSKNEQLDYSYDERREVYNEYISLIKNKTEALEKIENFNIKKIDEITWEEIQKNLSENTKKYIALLNTICPERLFKDEDYGLPEEIAKQVRSTNILFDGLKADLRKYQEYGAKYILCMKKVLLGDQMGLGKTVQAITAMVSLRNAGFNRFVVVCPASVVTNWINEIEKFSDLSCIKAYGNKKKHAFARWNEENGVLVTSYDSIKRLSSEIKLEGCMLVVDEAHYIKNKGVGRSETIRKIINNFNYLLFMTGTPLENKREEMINLIEFLRPDISEKLNIMDMYEYQDTIAPVYFRRKIEDVSIELPEKVENEIWCELETKKENEAYEEQVLKKNFMGMRRISWIEDFENSSKANSLINICEQAVEESRKVLVFSFFKDTIEIAKTAISNKFKDIGIFGVINGSVSSENRQKIIDEFSNYEGSAALFSQVTAGGVGLNIQAANIVVFCEPQVKPSIEEQAVSRSYRMGQTQTVFVYRLLCKDSVDERMVEILENKKKEFEMFADTSISGQKSLTDEIRDEDTRKIIEEEYAKVIAKHNNKDKQNNSEKIEQIKLNTYFNEESVLYYYEELCGSEIDANKFLTDNFANWIIKINIEKIKEKIEASNFLNKDFNLIIREYWMKNQEETDFIEKSFSKEYVLEVIKKIENKEIDPKSPDEFRKHQRGLVTPKMKMKVFARDNYKCVICGRSAKDGVKLEVDHIIPVDDGGLSEMSNLQTLCMDCNRGKGKDIYERELTEQEKYVRTLFKGFWDDE